MTKIFSTVTAILVELQNLPKVKAVEKARMFKGLGPKVFQSTPNA